MRSNKPVCYIATARALDKEMQQRIEQHKQQRPEYWHVIEEPLYLAAVLKQKSQTNNCCLVDCLTLWLNNLLCSKDNMLIEGEISALLSTIENLPGEIIFVSNETSMGIIPLGELTRRFCDEAGKLHQVLASRCDNVALTIAGLPQVLKGRIHE